MEAQFLATIYAKHQQFKSTINIAYLKKVVTAPWYIQACLQSTHRRLSKFITVAGSAPK